MSIVVNSKKDRKEFKLFSFAKPSSGQCCFSSASMWTVPTSLSHAEIIPTASLPTFRQQLAHIPKWPSVHLLIRQFMPNERLDPGVWSSLIGLTRGTTLADWSESEATILPDLSCFWRCGKACRQLIIVFGLLRPENWFSLKCVDESAVVNGIKAVERRPRCLFGFLSLFSNLTWMHLLNRSKTRKWCRQAILSPSELNDRLTFVLKGQFTHDLNIHHLLLTAGSVKIWSRQSFWSFKEVQQYNVALGWPSVPVSKKDPRSRLTQKCFKQNLTVVVPSSL